MKKTYINPTMEIVKIASQTQMLAGSNPTLGGSYDGSSSILSRESDWDDDDE